MVQLFKRTINIFHSNSNDSKAYTNSTIKDIFDDPKTLNENLSNLENDFDQSQIESINENLQKKSNFIIFATSIYRDDVQISLEEIIEDKIDLIIIQKIPPHLEDFNILQQSEIIGGTLSVSLSMLVGRYSWIV